MQWRRGNQSCGVISSSNQASLQLTVQKRQGKAITNAQGIYDPIAIAQGIYDPIARCHQWRKNPACKTLKAPIIQCGATIQLAMRMSPKIVEIPQGPHQQRHHFQTRMWARNWRHSLLLSTNSRPWILGSRTLTTEATMAKLRRSDARLH